MIALENLSERETIAELESISQEALARYGLHDLDISFLPMKGGALVGLASTRDSSRVHPYLGRLEGQQFAFRLQRSEAGARAALLEAQMLAALLRETDMPVPEPVPACDGSLVPGLEMGGGALPASCILFRWASLP